jgi:hypothetical protein
MELPVTAASWTLHISEKYVERENRLLRLISALSQKREPAPKKGGLSLLAINPQAHH